MSPICFFRGNPAERRIVFCAVQHAVERPAVEVKVEPAVVEAVLIGIFDRKRDSVFQHFFVAGRGHGKHELLFALAEPQVCKDERVGRAVERDVLFVHLDGIADRLILGNDEILCKIQRILCFIGDLCIVHIERHGNAVAVRKGDLAVCKVQRDGERKGRQICDRIVLVRKRDRDGDLHGTRRRRRIGERFPFDACTPFGDGIGIAEPLAVRGQLHADSRARLPTAVSIVVRFVFKFGERRRVRHRDRDRKRADLLFAVRNGVRDGVIASLCCREREPFRRQPVLFDLRRIRIFLIQ